jgi:hypothetical protein
VISSVAAKDADTCFELGFVDAEDAGRSAAASSSPALQPERFVRFGISAGQGPAVAEAISSLTQAR